MNDEIGEIPYEVTDDEGEIETLLDKGKVGFFNDRQESVHSAFSWDVKAKKFSPTDVDANGGFKVIVDGKVTKISSFFTGSMFNQSEEELNRIDELIKELSEYRESVAEALSHVEQAKGQSNEQ